MPYAWALLKLYAGSMKKPLLTCLPVGHEGLRDVVGDDAALDELSYSANLQDSEQYALPSVCLSQARQ